jgi:hypothetical protein
LTQTRTRTLIAGVIGGMIGSIAAGATVTATASSDTTLSPTIYQQYSPSGADFLTVNSAAGTVTVIKSPVLSKGLYVVYVDIQATAENAPNFMACTLATTVASDTIRYVDGSLGTDTGTEDLGSSNGQVTLNGTARIRNSNDKIVVNCSDANPIGARIAGWSVTEQQIATVVVN